MNRTILISMIILTGTCSPVSVKKNKNYSEKQTHISSNINGKGPEIIIILKKGESFYYPLFAVWLEDVEGNYLQTLYVSKSVATGVFRFAKQEGRKWIAAEKRAPQTLPYWAHKRGVKAADGLYMPDSVTSVPDAYTGATPITGFILTSKADDVLSGRFRVLLEINQNWDWNEYWTNDKYPGDDNYKMSCQPALVYEADIDNESGNEFYQMKPIGHSHYSGKTGELFEDLSTLTTALQIVDSIIVRIQ